MTVPAAPAGAPPAPARGRRELTLAVLGCAAAGALGFFAGDRPWVSVTVVRAEPLPPVQADVSGGALAPLVPGLALVVLAAAVALLATRRIGRILVGVLVAVAGAGMLAASAGWVGRADAVRAAEAADLASGVPAAVATSGPWFGLLAGVLAVLVGLGTVARSRTWPGMGARYETPERAAAGRAPADGARGTGPDPNPERDGGPAAPLTERQVWDALDRGEDPTDGPGAGAPRPPVDGRSVEGRAYSDRHHEPTRGTADQ